MKILSIFNTFANLRPESDAQLQGYIDGISSILMQKNIKQDIVLSSCLNTSSCRSYLMDYFEDSIYYSFIDFLHPLPVTVNLTVIRMEQKYGPYDAFLYIDSGVKFLHEDQIAQLYHIHKDNNSGMTSGLVDSDSGIFEGLKFGRFIDDHDGLDHLFKDNVYKIPLGYAVSLHCQLFDKSIYNSFNNKIYCDIFQGHASESIFSYVCASINKNYLLTNKVKVSHSVGLDGASSGFAPSKWVAKGNNRLDQPHLIDSIFRVIKDGQKYGLGYQAFSPEGIQPDKSKYSEDGFAISEDLRYYIRDNLYIPKNLLDYDKLQCDIIKL